MALPPTLAERLAEVDARIADAARAAGRRPDEITRIAVTKGRPAELVAEVAALGVRDVGESRHQEAEPKATEVAHLDLRWHFVGQLQSNKARAVARYVDVIHSLDRSALVRALADPERERAIGCFLQIDLAGTPGRGGVAPSELEALAEEALGAPGLEVLGVMGVAPLGGVAREAYAELRGLSERLQRLAPAATAISAGMSGDFEDAIAEGATHLRIGTAITGFRAPRV